MVFFFTELHWQEIYIKCEDQSEEYEERRVEKKEKRFACTNPNCKSTFKNKIECNFHIKNICNKPRRFKCAHCDYDSYKSGHVRRHSERKHRGLEVEVIELYNLKKQDCAFACPNAGCSKKYKYERGLRAHLKYECGKPGLKCSYCDFKNSYKHLIKKHWIKNHAGKEFKFEVTVE